MLWRCGLAPKEAEDTTASFCIRISRVYGKCCGDRSSTRSLRPPSDLGCGIIGCREREICLHGAYPAGVDQRARPRRCAETGRGFGVSSSGCMCQRACRMYLGVPLEGGDRNRFRNAHADQDARGAVCRSPSLYPGTPSVRGPRGDRAFGGRWIFRLPGVARAPDAAAGRRSTLMTTAFSRVCWLAAVVALASSSALSATASETRSIAGARLRLAAAEPDAAARP